MGKGVSGWVAENCKPIINGNPAVESGVEDNGGLAISLRSALAVPLDGVNGLVGVLSLYQAEADAFTSDHLRILQVITSKVGHFLENALKYRQAEDSATNDFLTGLPNARALSVHLDQELTRCKRDNSTVAVLEIDLNGFKEINDRYGHLAGDKVLKVFSTLMRKVCRDDDYTARMGGDEFLIVAPNMSPEAARERAKVLNAVSLLACREICGEDLLSISLGAAFFPQDGQDAEQLLNEADRRMYKAKQNHYKGAEPALPDGDAPSMTFFKDMQQLSTVN